MTYMNRDQDLIVRTSWQKAFTVCQVTLFQGGIDGYFVVTVGQFLELLVTETKSTVFLVVGGPIRDPLRMLRKRKAMCLQDLQRDLLLYRSAVAHYMQIAGLEVYDLPALRVLYICVPDVPFFRDSPIEDLSSSRDLVNLDRNILLKDFQGLPNAVPRNAATQRVQTGHEAEQILA